MKKTNIQMLTRKILAHQYFDYQVNIFNQPGEATDKDMSPGYDSQ